MQLRFVAAQQLGHVASLGRLGDELHALERAALHRRAALLNDGVLDQGRAVLGKHAQRVVELVRQRAGRIEVPAQELPDVLVQSAHRSCLSDGGTAASGEHSTETRPAP